MLFQLLTLLGGLIVGWARKGSLWSIVSVRLKLLWLLPSAYFVQQLSIHYLTGTAYELLLVSSYIALITFCAFNIRTPGVAWALGGTIANFAVLVVNGLKMPAYIPAVERFAPNLVPRLLSGTYGKSVAMTDGTKLNFLGDIFDVHIPPFPPHTLVSIGDILIAIGLIIFLQFAMRLDGRTSPSGGAQPETTS
ncbi:DUF5317 domain-containing protein [Alicyclobacillus sp.]|uniref:DUF5317 domain-containing protein n=1 Tax=Alicyclobacillus sp. TaxID=61169 RepID=UPI0025C03D67|nr:DUF5317 domain-containing protein [Alicyclobacillus sp.]MCL6516715.1 DUF5317 domain-containing protein [Alicyclobacillus sp.]